LYIGFVRGVMYILKTNFGIDREVVVDARNDTDTNAGVHRKMALL